jgi:cell division septal protein FtsQ
MAKKAKTKKEKKMQVIRIVALIISIFFLASIFILWGMYFIGR